MHVLFPARLAVRAEDADLARRILDTDASVEGEPGGEEEFTAGHEPLDDESPESWRDDEDGEERDA